MIFQQQSLEKPQKLVGISVTSLSCCNNITMVLDNWGRIFAWGTDGGRYGLFGTTDLFESAQAIRVSDLESIIQFSLSSKHAAAVNSEGEVYTWGTGTNGELGCEKTSKPVPRLVDSARIFTVKQVDCAATSTAICTGGGYVYIYGDLASSHHHRRQSSLMHRVTASSPRAYTPRNTPRDGRSYVYPFTLPELEQYFINSISSGAGFLATLTDTGEVFIFDNCLELARLPIPSQSQVRSMYTLQKTVYGISRDNKYLFEWSKPETTHQYKESQRCSLLTWTATVVKIADQYKDGLEFSTGKSDNVAVIFNHPANDTVLGEFGKIKGECGPYTRSQYAGKLIDAAYEALDKDLYFEGNFMPVPKITMSANSSPQKVPKIPLDRIVNRGKEKTQNTYMGVIALQRLWEIRAFREMQHSAEVKIQFKRGCLISNILFRMIINRRIGPVFKTLRSFQKDQKSRRSLITLHHLLSLHDKKRLQYAIQQWNYVIQCLRFFEHLLYKLYIKQGKDNQRRLFQRWKTIWRTLQSVVQVAQPVVTTNTHKVAMRCMINRLETFDNVNRKTAFVYIHKSRLPLKHCNLNKAVLVIVCSILGKYINRQVSIALNHLHRSTKQEINFPQAFTSISCNTSRSAISQISRPTTPFSPIEDESDSDSFEFENVDFSVNLIRQTGVGYRNQLKEDGQVQSRDSFSKPAGELEFEQDESYEDISSPLDMPLPSFGKPSQTDTGMQAETSTMSTSTLPPFEIFPCTQESEQGDVQGTEASGKEFSIKSIAKEKVPELTLYTRPSVTSTDSQNQIAPDLTLQTRPSVTSQDSGNQQAPEFTLFTRPSLTSQDSANQIVPELTLFTRPSITSSDLSNTTSRSTSQFPEQPLQSRSNATSPHLYKAPATNKAQGNLTARSKLYKPHLFKAKSQATKKYLDQQLVSRSQMSSPQQYPVQTPTTTPRKIIPEQQLQTRSAMSSPYLYDTSLAALKYKKINFQYQPNLSKRADMQPQQTKPGWSNSNKKYSNAYQSPRIRAIDYANTLKRRSQKLKQRKLDGSLTSRSILQTSAVLNTSKPMPSPPKQVYLTKSKDESYWLEVSESVREVKKEKGTISLVSVLGRVHNISMILGFLRIKERNRSKSAIPWHRRMQTMGFDRLRKTIHKYLRQSFSELNIN